MTLVRQATNIFDTHVTLGAKGLSKTLFAVILRFSSYKLHVSKLIIICASSNTRTFGAKLSKGPGFRGGGIWQRPCRAQCCINVQNESKGGGKL